MKKEQMQAILKYVQVLDPTGEIVKLEPSSDFNSGIISFGKDITQHRFENALKPEKWVEAYLITRLVLVLGYPASSLELQKIYPAGHPKTTKPRIDIVVRDDRHPKSTTFMLIEAKTPEQFESQKTGIEGQLFGLGDHERQKGLRYLVYYTVDYVGGKLVDRALIIDALQFKDFKYWDESGRPSLDGLPKNYAIAVKSVFVNKPNPQLGAGEKNLDKTLTRNEFLAIRNDLHNVLWGGGSTADNDIFSNLVKIFLAKIYDEQFTSEGSAYTFQVLFKDGKPQPATEIVAMLNSKKLLGNGQYEGLYRKAQKEYLELSDEEIVASQGLDSEKISPGKIAYVVEQLQSLSITENENKDSGDILGEFFEGIVRSGFKQSKGQFFTHTNIVKFCIYALKIDEVVEEKIVNENTLPYIIDPSCGSGTFLIEAMKLATKTVIDRKLSQKVHKHAQQLIASWFPPLKENIWAKDYIYGTENNPDLALATKVNMVLHGDGNINILIRDGLLEFGSYEISKKVSALAKSTKIPNAPYTLPRNEQFDVVLSNPPFSVDLDNDTKSGLAERFEYAMKKNSENLFIERWYQLLKPNGRMAVVLPEGVFDTGENDYIRLFLLRFFNIKAIVSLPELTFKPWTPTRTALVFATKKSDEEVLIYDNLWREKQKEFQKLLQSEPIAYILRGSKIASCITRLCSQYGIRSPLLSSPLDTVKKLGGTLSSIVQRADFDSKHAERAQRYSSDLKDWVQIDPNTLWNTKSHKTDLKSLLKRFYDMQYENEPIRAQIERHWEEIVNIADSSWWVFTEVSKDSNAEIMYFEVGNVGYKRTLNKERKAPNELFSIGSEGAVNFDDDSTVLGQIRKGLKY